MGQASTIRKQRRHPCGRCGGFGRTTGYVLSDNRQQFLCWACVRSMRQYTTVTRTTRQSDDQESD